MNKTIKIYKFLFCLVNSFIGLFAIKCHYNSATIANLNTMIYLSKLEYKDILFFLFFFIMWFIILTIIEYYVNKKRKKSTLLKISNKKLFFISAIVLLILWSPYYLTFFPGGVFTDTYNEYNQAIGTIIGNGNNIFHILYIRLLYYLCFKNSTFVFSVMTLIQFNLFLFTISYFMVWLNKKKVSKRVIILCLLYFGLYPRIPIYALSIWKDSLFNIFLFMYILFLYDIISSKGKLLSDKKNIIKYIVLSFLVSLFRNNSYYLIIVFDLILFIKYKELFKNIKLFYVGNICLILMLIGTYNVLFKVLNYYPPYRESIGISLQQISYVYLNEEDDEDTKYFIGNLFKDKEDLLLDHYSPTVSDITKIYINNDYLENNKREYWKYYFKFMKKYPKDYFKSYLFITFGYWDYYASIKGAANGSIRDFYEVNLKELEISNNINVLDSLFNIDLSNFIFKIQSYLGNSAIGHLFMFIGIYMLLLKKQIKRIIYYLPGIFILFILLVGSPIAFSPRYIIFSILFIPLSLILPFMKEVKVTK